jgi:hypothetical protein
MNSSLVVSNKQVKLFNKILSEFYEEYNLVTGSDIKIKAKSKDILLFKNEVQNKLSQFMCCDDSVLDGLTLIKKYNLDITKLNWEYIHTLYFISYGKSIDGGVVSKCKEARLNKKSVVVSKSVPQITPENSESFGKLIGDIAGQVAKSLEGKDLSNINPQELLTGMMSGNMNIAGINFQEILDNSTKNFKAKVDSGEIDVNDFTNQAKVMMEKLNLDDENVVLEEVD